ncbi:hypothetical protein AB4142_18730 [Variovorax sp. 2RAF20]|jgi:hypothetical protein
MELRNLPLGKLFMNLLREDAGMSSMEFAVFSALAVFLYLIPLLAALLIN